MNIESYLWLLCILISFIFFKISQFKYVVGTLYETALVIVSFYFFIGAVAFIYAIPFTDAIN